MGLRYGALGAVVDLRAGGAGEGAERVDQRGGGNGAGEVRDDADEAAGGSEDVSGRLAS